MLSIRQFSRKYDLEIIPVSYKNLTLCKCVWDAAIFGKPKFTHPKMPDYILATFLDAGIMTLAEAETYISKFRNQPLEKAAFFNINIDVETSVATEMELDAMVSLKNEVKAHKIEMFTFSNIQYKELEFADRAFINSKLDTIKAAHWDDYDQDLRRAFIITQLYYGTIKIYIKREFNQELNLSTKGFVLKNDIATNAILEYEFDNADLPFAMKLERVKHFN